MELLTIQKLLEQGEPAPGPRVVIQIVELLAVPVSEGHNSSMSPASKTPVETNGAPAAIGPYTQAVRIGDMVFTSGQVGLDPATGIMVLGGVVEQTTRALENLSAVLSAAGLGMSHVVKTTVFLKDMRDFSAMNEVYARFLAPAGTVAPARSTVQVAALPKDALVEIELIAQGASTA